MAPKNDSDSDQDDVFYYRYCSSSSTQQVPPQISKSSSLAPSKSTLYVSNIDYSLTNSDIHTLFSTFGRIARVTVLKDRHTRLSRGVAFIQFVSRDDARRAAKEMHRKILNGRTLSASIAVDNGRATEFIRKRVYKDTGRCFECGEPGHLSYECPKNQLGPRERPLPKRGRRGGGAWGGGRGFKRAEEVDDKEEGLDGGGCVERFMDDNWASVVDDSVDERLLGRNEEVVANKKGKKGKKKAAYFSDESGDDDDDDDEC